MFKIYEDIWPILATRTGSVHRGPENHKKYPKKTLSLAYPCDSYRFFAIEGQKTIKNTQKKTIKNTQKKPRPRTTAYDYIRLRYIRLRSTHTTTDDYIRLHTTAYYQAPHTTTCY